jgi:hypothetical protein
MVRHLAHHPMPVRPMRGSMCRVDTLQNTSVMLSPARQSHVDPRCSCMRRSWLFRLAGTAGETPLIRAGSGGAVLADALYCAEEGAGGSRSSSATAGGGGGAEDLELDSVGI